MMYIYRMNILVENDDISIETDLDCAVEKAIEGKPAKYVSSNLEEISGSNFGKCYNCGCWTSDYSRCGAIRFFSNGAMIHGKWLCDICLPSDHKNSF